MSEKSTKDKQVLFISEKYPYLDIVFKPEDVIFQGSGNHKKRIKGVHLTFSPNSSHVGEYRTSDSDHIAFIKSRQFFKNGYIEIAEISPVKDVRQKVKQGTSGTGPSDEPDENAPPADGEGKPSAPMTPKRRKKKRKHRPRAMPKAEAKAKSKTRASNRGS